MRPEDVRIYNTSYISHRGLADRMRLKDSATYGSVRCARRAAARATRSRRMMATRAAALASVSTPTRQTPGRHTHWRGP
eukprot:1729560-Pleurochrysis_carterae.AAC.1